MCGIVGQISFNKGVDLVNFNLMRDSLEHRGPDGYGTEIMDGGSVALGHRRLSIIDLSEHGLQPMCNEDRTIWITFNGEIYNFVELKQCLLAEGHIFRSESDTEVIVHGYEQWGTQVFSMLKGMFALGIYDSEKRMLTLARDRFGIKPLYYCFKGGTFTFASELKAILKSETFQRELDWSAVNDFFVYRFIPTPKTIWKGVSKLEAASFLQFDLADATILTRAYWTLQSSDRRLRFEDVVDEFDMLVRNSVKEHLLSDVPVGVFLSGGYDSTAMVYYMDQLRYPVESFSIGFENWARSEHLSARAVSDIFMTKHVEKILSEERVDSVGDLSFFYDEPQGGSSFIPTYEVCKLASEDVKVVIAGDGGDELMAGYTWHKTILDFYDKGLVNQLKSRIAPNFLINKYQSSLSWANFSYKEANALFRNQVPVKDLPEENWVYKQNIVRGEHPLKSLQRLDISTFLLDVFLPKVDRASMANSIEVRVPFLDHKLMEFMFSLSPEAYYDRDINKVVLNSILKRKLPDTILNKPKQGFGSPFNKVSQLRKVVDGILNGTLNKEGLLDRNLLSRYIENQRFEKLWPLYIFEKWYCLWNQ